MVLFRGPQDFSKTISINDWVQLAITFDENKYTAYQDGVKLGSKIANTLPNAPDAHVYIGAREHDPSFNGFKGDVDEIRIFKRSLTQDEVQFLYNNVDLINY